MDHFIQVSLLSKGLLPASGKENVELSSLTWGLPADTDCNIATLPCSGSSGY